MIRKLNTQECPLSDADRYEFNHGIGHADVQKQSAMFFPKNSVRIWNLSISEGKRGEGLGTQMMVELLSELKKSGANSVWLDVKMGNNAAYRLYSKLGFIPSLRTSGDRKYGILERRSWQSEGYEYLHELVLKL